MKQILNRIKNTQYPILVILFSVFIGIFTLIPITIKFYQGYFASVNPYLVCFELFLAFVMQYLFFITLFSLGFFGLFLSVLLFIGSVLVTYFFISLGKNIDVWVIGDIFENIQDLTFEYISGKSLLIVALIAFVFGAFARLIQKSNKSFNIKKFIFIHSILILIIVFTSIFDELTIKKVRQNYPPLNIINSISKYIKISQKSSIHMHDSKSVNLVKQSHISYKSNKKPKTIVLIIGESLRNDYFYELLPKFSPKLKNDKNIVFFNDVSACETLTRKSIPCLITGVDNANWQNFLASANIIDVFNSANFATYWIDNQSLYGYFDATYSFLARPSDSVIEQQYIRSNSRNLSNFDEEVLPYVKQAVEQKSDNKKDKFILIHLLGSHWHLDLRYPKEYNIFSPHCSPKNDVADCSTEEIKNSYKNSVVYSLKVLERIIDLFVQEDALIFFTPDHGFSLGEGGKFGNGAENKPSEQISVPLFVWYSDGFKSENQSIVKSLSKNSNIKIDHSFVFHSVIGCADIKSDVVNEKLNLCR